jgi:hypothetical protein
VIVTRATYEDEMVEFGLTGEKLEVYSQKHAFIDRDIFFDWLKDTLIPDLIRRRANCSYEGTSFLLLDNCTAHFGPCITDLCDRNRLQLLYIPPHSSHFLQCLDVSVFGLTKKAISDLNRTEDANPQTKHIVKMVNGFLSAATPTNVVMSFRNSGISLARTGLDIRCKTTPNTVRLFNADELLQTHVVPVPELQHIPESEESTNHDESANMDLEGYAMTCAAVLFQGQEEEGERPD